MKGGFSSKPTSPFSQHNRHPRFLQRQLHQSNCPKHTRTLIDTFAKVSKIKFKKYKHIIVTSIVTPGSIVPSNKKKAITNGDAANNNTKATRDPDAIWGQEEIDGHDPDFDDDGRVIPAIAKFFAHSSGSVIAH